MALKDTYKISASFIEAKKCKMAEIPCQHHLHIIPTRVLH